VFVACPSSSDVSYAHRGTDDFLAQSGKARSAALPRSAEAASPRRQGGLIFYKCLHVEFRLLARLPSRQLVQYVAVHVVCCSGWSLCSMMYLARLGRRVSRRMKLRTRREYGGDKPTRISMDRASKDERVQRELLQVGPIPLSQKKKI